MLSYYSLQELKNTQTLTNSFHNHHRINHPQRHQHYDNHHGLHHHDHPPHHLRHPPFSLPPPPFPPPPLSRVTPLSPFPPTSSNHQHRRPEGGFADSPLHHHHHRTHHVYDDRSPIHHLTQFHEGFDDFSSAVDRHRFDFVKSRVPPSPVFHRQVDFHDCLSPPPPTSSLLRSPFAILRPPSARRRYQHIVRDVSSVCCFAEEEDFCAQSLGVWLSKSWSAFSFILRTFYAFLK